MVVVLGIAGALVMETDVFWEIQFTAAAVPYDCLTKNTNIPVSKDHLPHILTLPVISILSFAPSWHVAN